MRYRRVDDRHPLFIEGDVQDRTKLDASREPPAAASAAAQGDHTPFRIAFPGHRPSRKMPACSPAFTSAAAARAGVRLGTQVGRFVIKHYLKPLK